MDSVCGPYTRHLYQPGPRQHPPLRRPAPCQRYPPVRPSPPRLPLPLHCRHPQHACPRPLLHSTYPVAGSHQRPILWLTPDPHKSCDAICSNAVLTNRWPTFSSVRAGSYEYRVSAGRDCDGVDDGGGGGAGYGSDTLETTNGCAVVISTVKEYQDSPGLEELRSASGWV